MCEWVNRCDWIDKIGHVKEIDRILPIVFGARQTMEFEMEFSTLPVEFIVRKRPPGGTTYLFSWTHDVNKGTFYILIKEIE